MRKIYKYLQICIAKIFVAKWLHEKSHAHICHDLSFSSVALLTVKQQRLAPQGPEIVPGPRALPGTVGWSGLACLVQFHRWRRRE